MLVLRLGNVLSVGFEQLLIQRAALVHDAADVLGTFYFSFSYGYGYGYGVAAGIPVLLVILLAGLVPLWSEVITSPSSQAAISEAGGMVLVPRDLTLNAYGALLRLRHRYGTLDSLDEARGGAFRSRRYGSWEQIPPPSATRGHAKPGTHPEPP